MNIDFREDVQKLIEYRRFDQFTPIQQKAIPLILKGRDVVGISATGTGKSHAFILPILQKVDTASNTVQALIIAPTRELAIQLYKMTSEINMFNPDIRIKLIASGKDKERMIDSLSVQPHIVIGTVGWLKDLFVDESVLRLDNASTVVIDEADMTLEMGFIDDVDMILGKLNRRLQIAVFSATVPDQLQSFLRKYMYRPQIIEANEASPLNPQIEHVLVNCRYSTYQQKLLKILPGINPFVCMIFARTKKEVIETAELLKDNGYDVVEIHGDLNNRERKQALKTIGSDAASYIVCSDIMARGLDIESVSHVISLGLPSNLDYYTHRCGRTGRSGRTGTSYILFTSSDIPAIRTLKEKFNFVNRDYRRGEWVETRDFDFRPRRHSKEASSEIKAIRNRPVKQVKPGYRKKRKEAIESIERRERRLAIKQKIREEQKERARKAQRQKGGY